MFVRDCMTPNPTTIGPGAGLEEALALMRALKIRHLPVMDEDRLIGIVTYTDLMRALPSSATSLATWEIPALLRQARVADIMSKQPITVAPDLPVEQAAYLLRKHKIGSLPVVDHDRLVGIVTETDLFDVLVYLLGGDVPGVRLTVELPEGMRDLGRLADLLASVVSGLTFTISVRVDGKVHRAYVRVGTASPLVVAEHLAAANFEVSGLRFDPGVRTA